MATAVSSPKIMLIEDDVAMLAVLRTLLELEGYQVAEAGGKRQIAEIVQAIRDDPPQTILLDVHLQKLSGFDILQQIRADPQICHTRVVMSSGMDVADQCLAAGADDFLLKPYMPDELIGKLRG